MVANKKFAEHQATHEVKYPETEVKTFVTPEITVEKEEPLLPIEEEITLRFTKDVEITINGKRYFGKEIVVKDMSLAAEIVRIARDGYGATILA